MRHFQSWLVPAALGACAALVIGAMTWLTFGTLHSERERSLAESRADLQERTRLALWRMDSLGAALLLDESTWPDTPSRLPVVERFVYSSEGSLVAPTDTEKSTLLKDQLGTGSNALTCLRLIAKVPEAPTIPDATQMGQSALNPNNDKRQQLDWGNQQVASWVEQSVRSKAVASTLNRNSSSKLSNYSYQQQEATQEEKEVDVIQKQNDELADIAANDDDASQPSDVVVQVEEQNQAARTEAIATQPRVSWLEGRLYLVRRVQNPIDGNFFDGAWIDHEALSQLLLKEADDLFATATLIPSEGPRGDGMELASFPFRLELPAPVRGAFQPDRATLVSLGTAWAAALFALLATTVLVRGVMQLSERRASFVSAVTHELRTPLTTFRLYSDMLGTGAVKEEKRSHYLHVLSTEADRLSHLVENVLAFSRIERGSARSKPGVVSATDLLEPLRERFEARLGNAGLSLEIRIEDEGPIKADKAAVEHVLFNLIDNAAKYASGSEPALVTISTHQVGHHLDIAVTDYGPGIPPHEQKRVFKAFHKSARDAAETKPGVGLGLALSRRLAERMQGELRCEPMPAGCRFVLRLPMA